MQVAAMMKTEKTKIWREYANNFRKVSRFSKRDESFEKLCLEYARKLFDKNCPIIYEPQHFSALVGYSTDYLYGASNSQELFYRTFSVPKKSSGYRIINEPLPSLKEIQRWILDEILNQIPSHSVAKGFSKGQSIRDNAKFHRGQTIVLTLDVKNFFPSINDKRVYRIFRSIGYSKPVSGLLTNLTTLNGELPQGAPTSPYLSNLVFAEVDTRIFGYCRKHSVRYTRYADDLTFSGEFSPPQILNFVSKVFKEYKFKINPKKTRVMRKDTQQLVTGIVVNEKLQSPRNIRKFLRQECYYIEKYGLEDHLLIRGVSTPNYLERLLGMADHALFVNPTDHNLKEIKSKLIENKKMYVT